MIDLPDLFSEPAERRRVENAEIVLSDEPMDRWMGGTDLLADPPEYYDHPQSRRLTGGGLVVGSLRLLHGDTKLEEGRDFLVDYEWGKVRRVEGSRVPPNASVRADYEYSLRRIDALVRTEDGGIQTIRGRAHVAVPELPEIPEGLDHFANVFHDYGDEASQGEIFEIIEPQRPKTATTRELIPRTMAKIRAGEPVRIVCWGDSVTSGGDASADETRYPNVLQRVLRDRFPDTQTDVEIVAVGGTSSRNWLYPETHPHGNAGLQAKCEFERIARAGADLVTVEFVNDALWAAEDRDGAEAAYTDMVGRIASLGAEVILITPHFTMPAFMGFESIRDPDPRPYVAFLREFAVTRGIGLADAAARWEHLHLEGIPYLIYLVNRINHPDDRGHRIFAEELLANFE